MAKNDGNWQYELEVLREQHKSMCTNEWQMAAFKWGFVGMIGGIASDWLLKRSGKVNMGTSMRTWYTLSWPLVFMAIAGEQTQLECSRRTAAMREDFRKQRQHL